MTNSPHCTCLEPAYRIVSAGPEVCGTCGCPSERFSVGTSLEHWDERSRTLENALRILKNVRQVLARVQGGNGVNPIVEALEAIITFRELTETESNHCTANVLSFIRGIDKRIASEELRYQKAKENYEKAAARAAEIGLDKT